MSETTQAWEERIDDTSSVLWSSSDPHTRRVLRVIKRTPLLAKQKAAGVPKEYRAARLDTWDNSRSNPGTKEIVQNYVSNPVHSLYLYGETGRGKTFAAFTIVNELLQRGKAVRFQLVSDLLLSLRDSFGAEGASEKSLLRPLCDVQYLLLDELGDLARNHDRTGSDFSSSRILTLLDSRWRTGKPTILTSNLSMSELERWADDPRIASRIGGTCTAAGVWEIQGRDLRVNAIAEEVRAE
jgi:DNA replication protein DnaC